MPEGLLSVMLLSMGLLSRGVSVLDSSPIAGVGHIWLRTTSCMQCYFIWSYHLHMINSLFANMNIL